MRAAWIAIVATVGCKGSSSKRPAVIDAATPVAVAVAVDAGKPWYALPVDASPDAREYTDQDLACASGSICFRLLDVPKGPARTWFLRPHTIVVAATDPSARISSFGMAPSRAGLLDMLAEDELDTATAPVKNPKGTGPDVDLQFAGGNARDLFKLLGAVEHRNYVLPPWTLPAVDIAAKQVPADAAARMIAAAIGLSAMDKHGNLTYLHDPVQPGLDPALVARTGPTLDLDAHAARAGELYAALVALGIDPGGGAGCEGGEAIDLHLAKVKAGVAIAAIAVATDVPPGTGGCDIPTVDRDHTGEIRVIASVKQHSVAVVVDANGHGLVDSATQPPDTIGASFIHTSTTDVTLYPSTPGPAPGAWYAELPKARFAAVLLDGPRRDALVELPDGTVHALASGYSYHDGYDVNITIEGATLTFEVHGYGGPYLQGTLRLRER